MKPLLQSALATGAIALLLAAPAAPLAAAPGSPVRSGPAAAVLGQTGPEAIPVHDRWDHRHRSGGRHHGYPGRRAYRHRPHRHHPYRHRPHRPRPHWGAYIYWGIPHPVSSPGRGGGAIGATTIIAMTGATATGFRATAMSAAMAGSRSSCRCPIRRAITGSAPDPVRRLQPRFRARALRASRLSVSTTSAKAMAK